MRRAVRSRARTGPASRVDGGRRSLLPDDASVELEGGDGLWGRIGGVIVIGVCRLPNGGGSRAGATLRCDRLAEVGNYDTRIGCESKDFLRPPDRLPPPDEIQLSGSSTDRLGSIAAFNFGSSNACFRPQAGARPTGLEAVPSATRKGAHLNTDHQVFSLRSRMTRRRPHRAKFQVRVDEVLKLDVTCHSHSCDRRLFV